MGSVFGRIQHGDFVTLTTWREDVVAVTAQRNTESTSAAPSERYRSRLAAAFFAASFTLALAGLAFLSAVLAAWPFAGSRRLGFYIVSIVIFGVRHGRQRRGDHSRGTLRDALMTPPVIVAAGLAVVGGAAFRRLMRRRREKDRILRRLSGS